VNSKERKKRFSDLSELGCIACHIEGYKSTPPEIHHIRAGQGMSQRAPDDQTIPLCPTHHRYGGVFPGLHSDPKQFCVRYGTERELLERVNNEINV
jgi:hypothetical protein